MPPVIRVGLLGGSFNPAHEGHVHVSRQALDRLGLDEVWWLVSPQNPLKDRLGMASLENRLNRAGRVASAEPRIHVTAIERDLGSRYTIDTVTTLKARFPERRFVWMMGADNLIQISRWRSWKAIMRAVPIAVFPRPTYNRKALSSRAARRFAAARKRASRAKSLAGMRPPAWVFLRIATHPASATRIRAETGSDWTKGLQG